MDDDALKRELIAQMGSRDNKTALAAVEELRIRGWLADGSLMQASLSNIDLSGADLSQANLFSANLSGTNLSGTNLTGANLSDVDLRGSELSGANLSIANMNAANISAANMSGANISATILTDAYLVEASLAEALLWRTQLSQAHLHGADFTGALCWLTQFIGLDLSTARGLEQIQHIGRSYVDFQTLQRTAQSGETLPEVFLRGCGLTNIEIQFAVGMYGKAINLYSAFISYNHEDQSFVDLLYNTLQGSGVRCWQDKHELDPGQKMHHAIASSIRLYDKILLICSESSLNSRWVHREIEMALQKEEELSSGHVEGVIALIPVDIDGYLFSEAYQGPYKAELKGRLAARFAGWDTNHAIFEEQFALLLRSLNPARESRSHPEPRLKKKPKRE